MTNNNNQMDIKEKTIARLLKKGRLRGRIDAKCCECIYDPIGDGTWRYQVEICTSFACPLYPVRPTTIQETQVTKEKVLASGKAERGNS